MNIVLDTNVLVSAIFFGGTPAAILKAWYRKQFHLILTEAIYNEYIQTYTALQKKNPHIDSPEIFQSILENAIFVTPVTLPEQVCKDQDDDMFIACALSAKATIITGDKFLLAASGYHNISIITPRIFTSLYL